MPEEMPKNDRQEDARRQGQFEGRIEAKVDGLITSVDSLTKINTNLETRLRGVEDGKSGVDEKFKDSERTHEDLYKQIGVLGDSVTAMVKYQNLMRGVVIALGVISTVISPIVTALILQAIKK
jgi:hypothetical protein